MVKEKSYRRGGTVKQVRRRAAALILAVFMVVACAGCMVSNVEELYSLPQLSEEYVQLQELIGQRIDEGGAYAAPTGGNNRQSVQLQDLDGDGTAEALAFLTDGSRTPTICIYRQNEEGNYYLYVVINGEGSAVASVEYADLNGDSVTELIVAWQISGDIRLLSVYALGSAIQAEQVQLLSVDCSEFLVCDLDGDGTQDLMDLRIDYTGGCTVTRYGIGPDGQVTSATADLSAGVTKVRRLLAGLLADGTTALFVESNQGDMGLVTDVFTAGSGGLRNITANAEGRSSTLREAEIFAADVNGDGAMELPSDSGDLISWYSLYAGGSKHIAATTCYSADDGWYLVLTGLLTGDLSVSRSARAEERSVTFTVADSAEAPPRAVLIVYALTGENRLDRGSADGRFILRQEEETVYAALLLTDELTQQDIQDNFYLIYNDWQSGDL